MTIPLGIINDQWLNSIILHHWIVVRFTHVSLILVASFAPPVGTNMLEPGVYATHGQSNHKMRHYFVVSIWGECDKNDDNDNIISIFVWGGSFRGESTYKPKKEFACRMCAGPPTSAIKRVFCVHQPSPLQNFWRHYLYSIMFVYYSKLLWLCSQVSAKMATVGFVLVATATRMVNVRPIPSSHCKSIWNWKTTKTYCTRGVQTCFELWKKRDVICNVLDDQNGTNQFWA